MNILVSTGINPTDINQLTPSKPMVRTHPITGWKTVWGFGLHVQHIDDVTEIESQELLSKITRLVSDNHDLQVRFRWSNSGDMGKYFCTLRASLHDRRSLALLT